ncbi:MAG: MlaE family lipid ABC transporter permease subunit [Calditrichia bacterium]
MNISSEAIGKPESGLQWEVRGNELQFAGALTLENIEIVHSRIMTALRNVTGSEIYLNLAAVNQIDSAGFAFLNSISSRLEQSGTKLIWRQIPDEISEAGKTFALREGERPADHKPQSLIENIGEGAYRFFADGVRSFFYLMANTMYWTFTDMFSHRHRRKGEFVRQTVLIGADSIPIIALISFLIGLVLALQSAAQLRQFGANIFVADLIVISMTREMGPLLTAIMFAGRSGSAIASEIGTMVVTEEVDALKTMAINPIRYLVVPKMHAMIFSLPLLTLLADIVGILGGVVIGYFYLSISPWVFYNRMISVLIFRDLMTGFIKSLIFAGLIVITGSFYGFRVKGGAQGVGKVTTAAVVTAIFLVILADSLLGLLFYFD